MAKNSLAHQTPALSPTPAQTAKYTVELIETLRKIASQQGQILLAHFLEIAAFEARAQASTQAQDTRLPE
jgi:uncharacterized protein (DUF2141 family)